VVDLSQFLTGGAAGRADSLSGLTPQFQSALTQMFAGAPPGLQISSAYRSPELQARLWQDALAKYGSPEAARKWVAPPGNSQHNHGNAVDLAFANDAAREWAHANAANYGLAFPLANENWHLELAGARGGGATPAPAPGTPAPTQAPGPQMAGAPASGGMMLGDIAAAYLQNFSQRQQQRAAEEEAEAIRRAALLGGGGLGGLYG